MAKRRSKQSRKWYSMDAHLHTPASSDYHQPEASFLDILQRADKRGLDIIAFTDHNTVGGYRKMMEEIDHLRLLKTLNRILPEEDAQLKEFERLLEKILVLPGFEFTATFGFHILGLFPPEKTVREIEHILLQLQIPPDQLDVGSVTVGASSDVLTAYRLINEAGGLAIAAHANSSNGVAMRGFPFGGQTKIAFTQDSNLHALEVTDLEKRGRHTTQSFFQGTKPEYPRRMHCIQGSDAHRLDTDSNRRKNLGVGERVTEVLLPERKFEALKDLFLSNDFARTRPRRVKSSQQDFDFIRTAREEGSNIVQDFHEQMTVRGGKLYAIIADVCAFANANGGTVYIGMDNDVKNPVKGINNPSQAVRQIEKEISNRISPVLNCSVDVHKTGGQSVLRVLVPRGDDPPYAVDDNKIYIREEAETNLAVRDEIVNLVKRSQTFHEVVESGEVVSLVTKTTPIVEPELTEEVVEGTQPRTGVEVVSSSKRNNQDYYALRDLRNGNVVQNVTKKSARRLWHYAITTYSALPKDLNKANVKWQGNYGLLKDYKHGNRQIFDLVQKENGKTRYYFGVTEDGVHGEWRKLVGLQDEG
ncbi:MAG TPA: RNA-binding domain-containing protein [Anaerolineales bacterium]|nr:RNA-binding domain-containing protein [Anaerolineales bacterium]